MKVDKKAQAVTSAIQEAMKLVKDLGDEDALLGLAQIKLHVWRRAYRLDHRRTVSSARGHFLRAAARLGRRGAREH